MLTKNPPEDLKMVKMITLLVLSIPNHSNQLLIHPTLPVQSGTKLTPCLIDSKINSKKTLNNQKTTKSKVLLTVLNTKSNLPVNKLVSTLMLKKDMLILKNFPLLYKLLLMMKPLLGNYPHFLMQLLLMLNKDQLTQV